MKNRFISAVLIAVLGMMAAGCQKEAAVAMYEMTYTVDNAQHHQSLADDAALDAFIGQLAGMTLEGHRVVFYDSILSAKHQAAKEVSTFTTTDKAEATAWSAQMYKLGYSVTMSYNPSTGVYVCVADDVTAVGPNVSLMGTIWRCHKSYDIDEGHSDYYEYMVFETGNTGYLKYYFNQYNDTVYDIPAYGGTLYFMYTFDGEQDGTYTLDGELNGPAASFIRANNSETDFVYNAERNIIKIYANNPQDIKVFRQTESIP